MKKISIILLIVLAVALYPNGSNENAIQGKSPITTLDLPYVY